MKWEVQQEKRYLFGGLGGISSPSPPSKVQAERRCGPIIVRSYRDQFFKTVFQKAGGAGGMATC